jgi:putative ABC transport system substrate-binding protein
MTEKTRRIGLLIANYSQSDREGQIRVAAFVDVLRDLGWSDGRNIQISYHWSGGNPEHRKRAAVELVQAKPDVIVITTDPALAEVHRLSEKIPVVFAQVADPMPYVDSLARPGGHITGFQTSEPSLGGKWLGLLKEAAPNVSRVAVLFGSDSNSASYLKSAEAIAPSLNVEVVPIDIRYEIEIEGAIAAFASRPDSGLVLVPHPRTVANRSSIILSAARHRLPAIYPYKYFASEGGMISYGPNQIDQWRGAAAYVNRILRGEKPGELPVQAPTRFELVVNLRTARALQLNIPPGFPLRADEVIE